jgi:hypothetical protein
MAEVLINGVRQGWGDIEFQVLGMLVTGITELKLDSDQEKENEMGAGNEPVHRGRGNRKYSAKMKLYHYEVNRILAALPPGKDLMDVAPFTLNVVFKPVGSDTLKRIDVPMTEFKNSGLNVDLKQGDKSIPIDLDLVIGKPIYR